MKNKCNVLLSCAVVMGMGMAITSASAQDVTLIGKDSDLRVTGELLSFDGETFIVRSSIGEVSWSADDVLCQGEGCPSAPVPLNFTISGHPGITHTVFPALLTAFSAAGGPDFSQADEPRARLACHVYRDEV